jgi:hypothetical protein
VPATSRLRLEAKKKGEPFEPDLDGGSANQWDKKNVPVPSTEG